MRISREEILSIIDGMVRYIKIEVVMRIPTEIDMTIEVIEKIGRNLIQTRNRKKKEEKKDKEDKKLESEKKFN